MTKLDLTIERLRALPEGRQDAAAVQIDLMLDLDESDPLTPEQWAEIEARLDNEKATIPHEEVVATFRSKFSS